MKKLSFLLAIMLIGGMMFTGCTKDPEPTPDPEPDPTPTYSVVYTVSNTNMFAQYYLSDCFKLNVTYTDANGESVTETGLSLPWTKTVGVEAPFHAVMSGSLVYDEAELPDFVTFGVFKDLSVYRGESVISGNAGQTPGSVLQLSKAKFLQVLENDPDYLTFTAEATIE